MLMHLIRRVSAWMSFEITCMEVFEEVRSHDRRVHLKRPEAGIYQFLRNIKRRRVLVQRTLFALPASVACPLLPTHSFSKMIFSRFLLVAVAAVGVVAQSGAPEKLGMVKAVQ